MKILGIESSCDETAVAIVEDGRRVLSSKVASQTELHAPFLGVVPEVAAREHLRIIGDLYQSALQEANLSLAEIDAIAVTQGPGLIGALLVGVSFAKGLASASGKPLVPVDHVHAHVHGALLGLATVLPEVTLGPSQLNTLFPTLALVVSGGHTNLYLMREPTDFRLLASTVDDACGECFDKVAKILGFGYPGGPQIELSARQGNPAAISVPTMVEQKTRLEFSYSGLKTHMANLVRAETKPLQPQRLSDLCAAFQDEALGQIIRKIRQALRLHPDSRSIIVSGGVAANQRFRVLLQAETALPSLFPALSYCGDNAAMIAAYAYYLTKAHGLLVPQFSPLATWDAYPRYDYESVQHGQISS